MADSGHAEPARIVGRLGRMIAGTDLLVEEFIESTPTSDVYRVRSKSISREFCAKYVRSGASAARLRRELEALGRLSHPHIVKLFRSIDLGEETVLVLDWANGLSLGERIATQGPMPPSEVIELARQLASALHTVHGIGLVHRDVKPHNIIIDQLPNGDLFAQLLDFGIAKPVSDSRNSIGFVGSPVFSAPEQITEEDVDGRTDIYQLGCVLFFALTGAPPFPIRDEVSVMNAHLFQPPPRVSDHVSSVRRWGLDDLILEMLAKSPEHRPQSMRVLMDRLIDAGQRNTGAGATNPLPPPAASISKVGPNHSIVSVRGSHVTVEQDGSASHFELGEAVTAICPCDGYVLYGTTDGKVCRLDLAAKKSKTIVHLPHARSIMGISAMRDLVAVVDGSGSAFVIAADGSYNVLRASGASGTAGLHVAGARDTLTLALVRNGRTLEIFEGLRPRSVCVGKLEFDVEHLVVSPDGYIVAAMGEDVTWLISSVDGRVLHRLRPAAHAASATFSGGTLIGVERRADGAHQFFEIY